MRHTLLLHPDSTCGAVSCIEVSVARGTGGQLVLLYQTKGIPELALPDLDTFTESMRADELWRHTCFEAFVRPSEGSSYFEFNFSPYMQWAAYRFEDYRHGRTDADLTGPLPIRTLTGGGAFELDVRVNLDRFPELAGDWRVGIAAVIEGADGRLSYWALRHPVGKPDFHHWDGFAIQLPAA